MDRQSVTSENITCPQRRWRVVIKYQCLGQGRSSPKGVGGLESKRRIRKTQTGTERPQLFIVHYKTTTCRGISKFNIFEIKQGKSLCKLADKSNPFVNTLATFILHISCNISLPLWLPLYYYCYFWNNKTGIEKVSSPKRETWFNCTRTCEQNRSSDPLLQRYNNTFYLSHWVHCHWNKQ